jgi:hypothetical protein
VAAIEHAAGRGPLAGLAESDVATSISISHLPVPRFSAFLGRLTPLLDSKNPELAMASCQALGELFSRLSADSSDRRLSGERKVIPRDDEKLTLSQCKRLVGVENNGLSLLIKMLVKSEVYTRTSKRSFTAYTLESTFPHTYTYSHKHAWHELKHVCPFLCLHRRKRVGL